MSALTLEGGSRVVLGTVLAKAGEGTIHQVVGRDDLVAKVFHGSLAELSTKLDKVAAMRDNPPGRRCAIR